MELKKLKQRLQSFNLPTNQMKIDVGVLGATGIVGQKLVELLTDHPWFNLSFIAASDRSQGKKYHEVVDWKGGKPLEPRIAQMTIHSCTPSNRCQWVFSALDSHVAGEIETQFADAGHIVFSNAKNHRMNPSVPLIIPEVNPHHLDCLTSHPQIITNPNCAVIGLCIALKPLTDMRISGVSKIGGV